MEVILKAIEILKKTFGGTRVNLISSTIERSAPTNLYPSGVNYVTIEIEGKQTILTYTTAEDILVYGNMVAEEIVYPCIAEKMVLYERILKINKIRKNESNNRNE